MTITKICDLLRKELLNNQYEYGFFLDGKRYIPDVSLGFDEEYFHLSKTIYRVQSPSDTKREKIGTCIDACMLMREMLGGIYVDSSMWLIRHREKGSVHTILTFKAEGKVVYLELTPESSKSWYGKENLYSSVDDFLTEFDRNGYDIYDVTDEIIIGEAPNFLLKHIE